MARPLQTILEELVAVRQRLAEDVRQASSGLRGGTTPRGVQLNGRDWTAGLDWVQGRIDADFQLPGLYHYFAELRMHDLENVPPWEGEPQDELKAFEVLERLIRCCCAGVRLLAAEVENTGTR